MENDSCVLNRETWRETRQKCGRRINKGQSVKLNAMQKKKEDGEVERAPAFYRSARPARWVRGPAGPAAFLRWHHNDQLGPRHVYPSLYSPAAKTKCFSRVFLFVFLQRISVDFRSATHRPGKDVSIVGQAVVSLRPFIAVPSITDGTETVISDVPRTVFCFSSTSYNYGTIDRTAFPDSLAITKKQ